MIIEINKDIDKYQESIVLGLTARQLLFSCASVLVGGSIVLLLYKFIGLTGSAYVAVPCIAPIALQGFYSFNGMSFFEYWRRKIYFLTGNKTLNYKSTEGDAELELYKRSVALAENNKKSVFSMNMNSSAKANAKINSQINSGEKGVGKNMDDVVLDKNTAANKTSDNKEDFEKMKEKVKRTFIATAIGMVIAVICALIAKQFI